MAELACNTDCSVFLLLLKCCLLLVRNGLKFKYPPLWGNNRPTTLCSNNPHPDIFNVCGDTRGSASFSILFATRKLLAWHCLRFIFYISDGGCYLCKLTPGNSSGGAFHQIALRTFMENWYLACHKTGKHNAFKAQMFLAQPQINVIVFIPQICSYRPRSDRPGQLKKVIEPLFPGYMFVCFDPEITHTSKISNCPGVSHLVRFSEAIVPIHDHIVEEIMQLPICVHTPELRDKKIRSPTRKHHPALTTAQHETLMNVVAEKDGINRSAMLYAFTRTMLE